ncbi:MAG: hypothetical protein WCY37_01325 [Candidatus Dojkabacteria bacterium]|jgi:hypothetical protein
MKRKILLSIPVTILVMVAIYSMVNSMHYAVGLGPSYVIITIIVIIGVSFIFFDTYKTIWSR